MGFVSVFKPVVATIVLIVLAPVMLVAALAVMVGSPGPILVSKPQIGGDGRIVYLTSFRTVWSFSPETYDCLLARRRGWLTPVGTLLRATGFERLPCLFDIRAGRAGFESLLA